MDKTNNNESDDELFPIFEGQLTDDESLSEINDDDWEPFLSVDSIDHGEGRMLFSVRSYPEIITPSQLTAALFTIIDNYISAVADGEQEIVQQYIIEGLKRLMNFNLGDSLDNIQ